jgi:hypothetical protein
MDPERITPPSDDPRVQRGLSAVLLALAACVLAVALLGLGWLLS